MVVVSVRNAGFVATARVFQARDVGAAGADAPGSERCTHEESGASFDAGCIEGRRGPAVEDGTRHHRQPARRGARRCSTRR
ncbi:hypothetical protein, partial [Frigoribacterium sp. MEB024]|uniref:hypothetical protein n=1 Tax=Frigoribacterium sp. MEB024 TaxID=1589899 RepID=UPI001E286073